jgi:tetratricopeptide (TPR) repeat protein
MDDPLTAHQHNELGYIYENQGNYELAEKEYQKAIRKDKVWAVPYFNLGNIYFKSGKPEVAVKYFRLSLERDQNNPDIMNNLAYLYLKIGEISQAQEWIDKALSIQVKETYLDTQHKIFEKIESNQVK